VVVVEQEIDGGNDMQTSGAEAAILQMNSGSGISTSAGKQTIIWWKL
jgi:hypothetical protein